MFCACVVRNSFKCIYTSAHLVEYLGLDYIFIFQTVSYIRIFFIIHFYFMYIYDDIWGWCIIYRSIYLSNFLHIQLSVCIYIDKFLNQSDPHLFNIILSYTYSIYDDIWGRCIIYLSIYLSNFLHIQLSVCIYIDKF